MLYLTTHSTKGRSLVIKVAISEIKCNLKKNKTFRIKFAFTCNKIINKYINKMFLVKHNACLFDIYFRAYIPLRFKHGILGTPQLFGLSV